MLGSFQARNERGHVGERSHSLAWNGARRDLFTTANSSPAEVEGVDFLRPVDDALFEELRATLRKYGVIILRKTALDDEGALALGRRFSDLDDVKVHRAAANFRIDNGRGQAGEIQDRIQAARLELESCTYDGDVSRDWCGSREMIAIDVRCENVVDSDNLLSQKRPRVQ
ncbi:hypothetical protein CLAIMM_14777 [Cladophialophora immunda]|nr:hypothetical protein CLAIMM_14777 [Cladophialophora immunda]